MGMAALRAGEAGLGRHMLWFPTKGVRFSLRNACPVICREFHVVRIFFWRTEP